MARGKLPLFERVADAERFAVATLKAVNGGTWVDRTASNATTLKEALGRYEREITPK